MQGGYKASKRGARQVQGSDKGCEAGTNQLQGVQSRYKSATRGARQVWGSYKGWEVDTRQLQGVQGGYEAATRGEAGTQVWTLDQMEISFCNLIG